MEQNRVIFVSAVSNEFHNAPPEQRHLFKSYRDVLKQAFRILAPHYEIIVQEDLALGFSDLLETLDHEITRSLFVVHLVGDLAGSPPEPSPLRSLRTRHPDLFTNFPILKDMVGEGVGITYTQWELYLAFHYGKRCLVFEAGPGAPRSPLFVTNTADLMSQSAHRRRIQATGHHRGQFQDQEDLARKTIRSFLHFRVDPTIDPVEPSAEALAKARSEQLEIVKQLAKDIQKPKAFGIGVIESTTLAAFLAAISSASFRWQVNLATIVDIAARHAEALRAASGFQPTPQSLRDEAFAELALGDYTAARLAVRRVTDLGPQFHHQRIGLIQEKEILQQTWHTALSQFKSFDLRREDIRRAIEGAGAACHALVQETFEESVLRIRRRITVELNSREFTSTPRIGAGWRASMVKEAISWCNEIIMLGHAEWVKHLQTEAFSNVIASAHAEIYRFIEDIEKTFEDIKQSLTSSIAQEIEHVHDGLSVLDTRGMSPTIGDSITAFLAHPILAAGTFAGGPAAFIIGRLPSFLISPRAIAERVRTEVAEAADQWLIGTYPERRTETHRALEEAFDQMNEHILGALDTKLRAKHNYLEDTVQMLREELAMRERRIVQNQEELRKVDAECKALDELLGQAKQSI